MEDAHFRYQIYDYSKVRVALDLEHHKCLRIVEALNGFFEAFHPGRQSTIRQFSRSGSTLEFRNFFRFLSSVDRLALVVRYKMVRTEGEQKPLPCDQQP